MSRRSRAENREVLGDPKFDSSVAAKFMNTLMVDGKKSVAESIFYEALDVIEERSGQPGLQIFNQAVQNAKPALEVKSRRVGGSHLSGTHRGSARASQRPCSQVAYRVRT